MRPRWMIAAVPAMFCLMALLGWSACTGCSGKDAQAKAAATRDAGSADEEDPFLLPRHLPVYYPPVELGVNTGKIDRRNRYLSAVRVFAKGIGAPKTVRVCSGVLVSPRLVLTAASCVCSPQPPAQGDGGQTLLDAKVCASIGLVDTTNYFPRDRHGPAGSDGSEYEAAVRVHPAFKQVLDEKGNVVSSEANLAVFVLDKAAEIPPVELAESDVNAGESLVVVGHGYTRDTVDVERVFSEHRVTEVLNSSGRVAFAQPPPFVYKGARGGPCLRQNRQGLRLSGILSASVGQEALFTSVYAYRDWVRAEIQGAADAGTSMPQPPVSP